MKMSCSFICSTVLGKAAEREGIREQYWGRRQVMKVLGIDIGGTQIKYGVVKEGAVLEHFQCDTPQEGYHSVSAKIIEIANQVLQSTDVDHIGLSVPGVIDISAGVVRYANNLGWYEAPICSDLAETTGKKVNIANDAHCAALGEALYGAGKGYSRMAMFTIGTGVGGGFIKDGKLETDAYGAMAYIFGHSVIEAGGRLCNCGRKGCLEAYASASAVSARSKDAAQTAKEIFLAAKNGDEDSLMIIQEFLEKFCTGVVNIANILRPQIIVIGGGVSASADMILPEVQRALEREVYGYEFTPIKVAKAMLGNTAGMIGAASL